MYTGPVALPKPDWSTALRSSFLSRLGRQRALLAACVIAASALAAQGQEPVDLLVDRTVYFDDVRYPLPGAIDRGDLAVPLGGEVAIESGDEVLIITLQGEDAGRWETAVVAAEDGGTLTLAAPLQHAYDGGSDRVMVQRVPTYGTVSVAAGGTVTAHAWDGATGGVLFFRAASVTVEEGGSIDASGLGYRGGIRNYAGESLRGPGGIGSYSGGSGAPNDGAGGSGVNGGGGNYAGGATDGDPYNQHLGSAGETYGDAELNRLHLGSGGAGGYNGRPGGDGGGIVYVDADTLVVLGSVAADGTSVTGSSYWGSGGGSGGSILLVADDAQLGNARATALGGDRYCGTGSGSYGGCGGRGGDGRIRVDAAVISGTTRPGGLLIAEAERFLTVTGELFLDEGRAPLATAADAGDSVLSIDGAPDLLPGDEILVITLQGEDAGRWETAPVAEVDGGVLTLAQPLQHSYDGADDRVMVQRVPTYDEVTVAGGGRLTAHPWDGATGGVLFFRAASVTVEAGGSIDASGLGYRGGIRSYAGESLRGPGGIGSYSGGSGAPNDGAGGSGVNGGGGDYAGGATDGDPYNQHLGGAGETYGDAELTRLHLGSGGAGGYNGRPGGDGGGIVYLDADLIAVLGTVAADGTSVTGSSYWGSGGGSGGSIRLIADDAQLGDARVTALGGDRYCGTGSGSYGGCGGHGGDGRIRVDAGTLAGTTEPAPGGGPPAPPGAPSAAFTAEPETGEAPLTVTFTNGSGDADGYLWDFGDGSSSTATSPVHTYVLPGTYSVTLTATNAVGSDSASATIAVDDPPPSLNVEVTPAVAFVGQPIQLVIEARDGEGSLDTSYRGGVELVETAPSSLPDKRSPIGPDLKPDYVFTEADAGRAVLTFAFHHAGTHSVRVFDRADPRLDATSNGVAVAEIELHAVIAPGTAVAGDETLTLTVEARDGGGTPRPEYRGRLEIVESASSTLPDLRPPLGNSPDYTFTDTDGGRAAFTFAFNEGGEHSVYVYDYDAPERSATSNTVAVEEISLGISISPSTGVAGDRVFTVTVEARAASGDLWPEYRGQIELTGPATEGLPRLAPPIGNQPDYAFTETDAGRAVFSDVAFVEEGEHALGVYDYANPARSAVSNTVTVTGPPPPAPADPGEPPEPYAVPDDLWGSLPPPIPFRWGVPFIAIDPNLPSNVWRGYPTHGVPTREGARYLISALAQWRSAGPLSTAYYACPYLAYDSLINYARASGGGLDGGPTGSNKHAATLAFGYHSACTGPIGTGPSSLTLGISGPAPAGAEGVHLDVHGGGNSTGSVVVGANVGFDGNECDGNPADKGRPEGDPIDTRSGAFYMSARDLGLTTGCRNLALSFERSYSSLSVTQSVFGYGWTHNYNQAVVVLNDGYVAVRRPRGTYYLYQDVGQAVYATRAGSRHALVKRPEGGWALVRRDRRVDLFDADGRLVAQQDAHGNLIWLTYEEVWRNGQPTRRLARVDAPGGRFLWLGYDYYQPGLLTQVADHTGRVVRYGYNEVGFLETVTGKGGEVTTHVYDGLLLSSETDPLGRTTFTNVYDDGGRVLSQDNSRGQSLSFGYETSAEGITTTVTEQNTGAVNTYVYDADGLLQQHVDPLGAVTRYRAYGETRLATEIENASGHVTSIAYDAFGSPTTITDPLGQTLEIAYDGWGNPVAVTDAAGRTTAMAYDGPELTQVVDPAGGVLDLIYGDQAGWHKKLSAIVDPAGEATSFSYDEAGDLVAIQDPLGGVTQLAHDALGRVTSVTDPLGHTTTLTYDVGDRLRSVADPLGATARYAYDPVGNLTRIEEPLGATTEIRYTDADLPAEITDASGASILVGYDPAGRPETLSDALGATHVVTYDLAGRPTAMIDALGQRTEVAYDPLGNVTSITDANGHTTEIERDALSRPVVVRDPLGHAVTRTYDAAGNVVQITDAGGGTVTIAYDVLGHPVAVTDPLGATTTLSYDARGSLAARTDGNGIVTRYDYDPLGRLREAIANHRPGEDPSADTNVSTRYAYDAVGNLTAITDPRGQVTRFTYDPLGRMLSTTDPLGRTMRYEHDARGLLTRWTKADGTAIDYVYDLLGLLTEVTAPDATIAYTYDTAGRRIGMSDPQGSTAYAYDLLGRITGVTLPDGAHVGYRYDAVGNRTALTYPDGREVAYRYDAADRLAEAIDWDGMTTGYRYDANGRPTQVALPNGITSSYSYDLAGNLLELVHQGPGGIVGRYAYTYDATGRRVGLGELDRTISYAYDALYRLTAATESTGASYAYTYDAAGNRLTSSGPGGPATATYDAANQLATRNGAAVVHDANGNLLFDGANSYVYDSLDRLARVTDGSSETLYGYNGDGDRLWQRTDGATTAFTLDLNGALAQVLEERLPGQATAFVPLTGGQSTAGLWSYLHTDGLGSVRHLTGPAGGSLGAMRYSPFGERIEATGIAAPFGFTGEPQGGATDLVYLRARFYNPEIGRFLTPDSLIPDLADGQTLNAFAYVSNDPVNLIDPSGNIGVRPAADIGHNPDAFIESARRGLKSGAEAFLRFLAWWDSKPEGCDCEEPDRNPNLDLIPKIPGQGAQLWWSFATTPARLMAGEVTYLHRVSVGGAEMYRRVATRTNVDVTKWGRLGPVNRGWKVTHFRNGYLARTPAGGAIQVENIGVEWAESAPGRAGRARGAGGSILGAGAIDAAVQLIEDLLVSPCLTPEQRAWRVIVAFTFGATAGLAGTLAAGALGGGAIAMGATSFLVSTATGLLLRPASDIMKDQLTALLE